MDSTDGELSFHYFIRAVSIIVQEHFFGRDLCCFFVMVEFLIERRERWRSQVEKKDGRVEEQGRAEMRRYESIS
jgi:hypothetical protein